MVIISALLPIFQLARSFLTKYFIEPIQAGSGYNVYNTLVYSIVFILFVLLFLNLFKKWKIKINKNFLLAVSPYILMGGLFRVLQDSGIVKSFLFVTPFSYFLTTAVCLLALIISRKINRKKYLLLWSIFAIVLDIILLSFIRITNFYAAVLIISLFFSWVLFVAGIRKIINWPFLTDLNSSLLLVHIFDATTTFVSVKFFNYVEEHVLATIFINWFGPAGIYIVKIPAVLLVLYVVEKEDDKQLKNMLKLCILILGLAPGLRNLLRLVAGV
ncbi:MAG: DUF63 family protein [Candidatus Aenigmarchaeota archaeon]|nr:DUF63 family protein [Candidatus Aenigmarchaeota archaeon]